jgi:hypothetical protein
MGGTSAVAYSYRIVAGDGEQRLLANLDIGSVFFSIQ